MWFAGQCCVQQQLKSVTPGAHSSGSQHQPWPLTHTNLQPRKGSTQQETHQCQRDTGSIKNDIFARRATLACSVKCYNPPLHVDIKLKCFQKCSCGFRWFVEWHHLCILSSCPVTHFLCSVLHTHRCALTKLATCLRGSGSADRLALAVKLAPFSYRCQVFCLAAEGAGVSLCQGCWVAANAGEGKARSSFHFPYEFENGV